MTPARERRGRPEETRLLRVEPSGALLEGRATDLVEWLAPGDLVVVNDAATLPASLVVRVGEHAGLEVRLAGERPDGAWDAVLFGPGSWRDRTEDRPAPPPVPTGTRLDFGAGLRARVAARSRVSPRWLRLRFHKRGDGFWTALYRTGRPVQYSHLARDLDLGEVQTAIAGRPWAVEAPSAGLLLTGTLLLGLRRRGVEVARVTHAAGLSAVGDPAIDAALPLPERYQVPLATAAAVAESRARGGRVVAIGTSVVRALESAAAPRGAVGRSAVTRLRLGPRRRPRLVDGLLTGIHEPGTSHFELLRAFLPESVLRAAAARAERAGFLGHEFGDAMLVLPPHRVGRRAA